MPAPTRIHNIVYILVPMELNEPTRAMAMLGLAACRAAYLKGLTPIFPWAMYRAFMTEEDLAKGLAKQSTVWAKRASRIWLVWPREDLFEVKLDSLSYKILMYNEGWMSQPRRWDASQRVPVLHYMSKSDSSEPARAIGRYDLATMLRCNIVGGMFHGLEL